MKKAVRLSLVALLGGGFLLTSGIAYYQGQKQRAATLGHLAALDARLAEHNRQTAARMATTVRAINYYTHLNNNRPQDQAILAAGQQMLQRTQSLTDTLQALQRNLRLAPGAGQNGRMDDGTVARLAKQLVSYSVLTYSSATAGPLIATLRSFARANRFADFSTRRLPIQATLAGLTRLETLVWRAGSAKLNDLAQKSGRSIDWYDPIRAFATAESETVAPGQVYQARLFLMDNNLHYYYTNVSVNGQTLAPSFEGSLLTFRVPANSVGRVPRQAQWRGAIRALANPEARPYATDSVWQLTVPYFIVSPTKP
ncbi:hypothetical protein [Hymenobacter ruricola]|uniref:Gliding motility-associated protein GldM N-terminal domain-containing protein n=1 Tax=Hymenobacter ruricola TaxID=2791023 RepID=A0ABS0I193_9BACT|nr:hypothetical protein [Hymenobacter ruricola]MBF9220397.1 hypothetical protein [Hymenobacter ruricola]